jgi:hypothetical protein
MIQKVSIASLMLGDRNPRFSVLFSLPLDVCAVYRTGGADPGADQGSPPREHDFSTLNHCYLGSNHY